MNTSSCSHISKRFKSGLWLKDFNIVLQSQKMLKWFDVKAIVLLGYESLLQSTVFGIHKPFLNKKVSCTWLQSLSPYKLKIPLVSAAEKPTPMIWCCFHCSHLTVIRVALRFFLSSGQKVISAHTSFKSWSFHIFSLNDSSICVLVKSKKFILIFSHKMACAIKQRT